MRVPALFLGVWSSGSNVVRYFYHETMPDASRLLFVYGTLRRGAGHPMHHLLAQYARWMGTATFPGKLVDLGEYPGAVASANPAHLVRGEVYGVLNAGTLFPQLDAYEEFWPQNPGGSLYQRQEKTVLLASGEPVTAWMYLYNRPVKGLPLVASGDWLAKAGKAGKRRAEK